jgi:hypothetical protein
MSFHKIEACRTVNKNWTNDVLIYVVVLIACIDGSRGIQAAKTKITFTLGQPNSRSEMKAPNWGPKIWYCVAWSSKGYRTLVRLWQVSVGQWWNDYKQGKAEKTQINLL